MSTFWKPNWEWSWMFRWDTPSQHGAQDPLVHITQSRVQMSPCFFVLCSYFFVYMRTVPQQGTGMWFPQLGRGLCSLIPLLVLLSSYKQNALPLQISLIAQTWSILLWGLLAPRAPQYYILVFFFSSITRHTNTHTMSYETATSSWSFLYSQTLVPTTFPISSW